MHISDNLISFIIISISCFLLLIIVCYQHWLLKILEKSRNNFRIFVDSSPYPFLFTDKELNIKTISKSTAELFSTEIRSIINKNIRTFISYDTYLQDKLQNRKNEFLMLAAETNKDKIPIECTIYSPFRQNDYFFWFLRDVRKDIDLQFFFQRMIDFYPFGFMKLDYKGNILQTNKKFREIFNFENYSNLHITLFFYWHNYYKIIENIRINGYESHEIEFELNSNKKDLEFFFFNAPINEHSIYCFIQEITSINELHQNLENALEEQRKLALEKDLFFAKMNHELRTPLNAIIGITDLFYEKIKNDADFNKYADIFHDLKLSSRHLHDIVSETLDFSKISTGKTELNEEIFDFLELIAETIFSFKYIANKKDLIIDADYPQELIFLFLGDKTKIRQILYNLLSNSVKFTDKGSITILIKSKGYTITDNRKIYTVIIDITDTGIGINEEDKDKLFRPFEQAQEGKTKGGTGLGLFISRELAMFMGGNLTFISQVGKGTIFTLTLKLKEALQDEIPKETKKESEHLNNHKGMLALIVDDVSMNRMVLRFMLEKINWKTQEASSGIEALEILDTNNSFKLIFMDISMPEMDGIQTLHKIREKNINIPVIACTAYAVSGDMQKFLDEGFNGYISKPILSENLIKEINSIMNQPHFPQKSPDIFQNETKDAKDDNIDEILVDYQKLIETCNGMEELARELLYDLINQGPLWLKEVEMSVKEQNIERIRKVAHLVSGTASTIHALLLYQQAKNLEMLVNDNKTEELSHALDEFTVAMHNTLRWCRKKLQEN